MKSRNNLFVEGFVKRATERGLTKVQTIELMKQAGFGQFLMKNVVNPVRNVPRHIGRALESHSNVGELNMTPEAYKANYVKNILAKQQEYQARNTGVSGADFHPMPNDASIAEEYKMDVGDPLAAAVKSRNQHGLQALRGMGIAGGTAGALGLGAYSLMGGGQQQPQKMADDRTVLGDAAHGAAAGAAGGAVLGGGLGAYQHHALKHMLGHDHPHGPMKTMLAGAAVNAIGGALSGGVGGAVLGGIHKLRHKESADQAILRVVSKLRK